MNIPDFGFMRLPQVLQVIPVSRSTWYDGIKQGRFPKGIKITGNIVGWKVSDIKNLVQKIEEEAASNA